MTSWEMYTQRAADCRREARNTKLANVRSRCLRAAQAWQDMADRAEQSETYRASEVERKANQRSTRAFYFISRFDDV